jgi:predicted HAD superfamily Cof-like phosphohydrolase
MPAWIQIKTDVDAVEEFHRLYRQGVGIYDGKRPETPLLDLRFSLIDEEFHEFVEAFNRLRQEWTLENMVEVCDALADLKYVINGFAVAFGLPLDAIYNEVHRSNMTKTGEDGKPIIREDGKILKGPNFQPPKIAEILYQHLTINQNKQQQSLIHHKYT